MVSTGGKGALLTNVSALDDIDTQNDNSEQSTQHHLKVHKHYKLFLFDKHASKPTVNGQRYIDYTQPLNVSRAVTNIMQTQRQCVLTK